jgi:imidazoleglycerol-phosphate dehydratase/histidinol-phosphatase
MISNQDNLGKEIFPFSSFERPQQRMLEIFKKNKITFEEIYICPHSPDDNCLCRKPKTGLIEEFLERNPIDRKNSFVYGDRKSDEEFAKNIGIKFIKVKTNEKFNLLTIL